MFRGHPTALIRGFRSPETATRTSVSRGSSGLQRKRSGISLSKDLGPHFHRMYSTTEFTLRTTDLKPHARKQHDNPYGLQEPSNDVTIINKLVEFTQKAPTKGALYSVKVEQGINSEQGISSALTTETSKAGSAPDVMSGRPSRSSKLTLMSPRRLVSPQNKMKSFNEIPICVSRYIEE